MSHINVVVHYYAYPEATFTVGLMETFKDLADVAEMHFAEFGFATGDVIEFFRQSDVSVAFRPESTLADCGIADGDRLEMIAMGSNV